MALPPTPVLRVVAAAVVLVLVAAYLWRVPAALPGRRLDRRPGPGASAVRDAAGNSTMGFGAAYYINLPDRFDRADAMVLQSYLTGVDVVEAPGVLVDRIKTRGMPPSHLVGSGLKPEEKACWRAHANVRVTRESQRRGEGGGKGGEERERESADLAVPSRSGPPC